MLPLPSDTLRAKLDASRKDLLDLGLRNSLLNFRPSKARGVQIADELSSEVFRILVQNSKSMTFTPAPEEVLDKEDAPLDENTATFDQDDTMLQLQAYLEQPDDEENDAKPSARHRDVKLQTIHPSAKLQARLLNTYYAARTHIEEQGVNVLFLALGMLTWYEAEGSTTARYAPLVLVPANLERSDALDRFHLTYTGEDVGDNLSLATKLKNDFGLSLPTLPDPEDLDLDEYFNAVSSAIKRQARWSVDENAIVLGFFSFGKFLMYRDLDVASWPEGAKPTDNAILRSLLEDGFREEESPISESDHLDQYLKPNDVNTVINADSTQTLAILDVNRGRNLVIQGPPGTGKSQTITNVIAEALGHAKRVLFVSEKMAALEVVKRRLDSIGLGDACLELHSHKTNKKGVLLELARTLSLGKPNISDVEGDLQALEQARDRLNAYSAAINTPIAHSGISPYLAYGRLLLFEERHKVTPLPGLDIPDLAEWSALDFRTRQDLLGELENHIGAIGAPKKHPFWGSSLTVFLPTEQAHLRESIDVAARDTTALASRSEQLAKLLELPAPTDRAETLELTRIARHVLEAPELKSMPLDAQLWKSRTQDWHTLLELETALASATASYGEILRPNAWTEELADVRQNLNKCGLKWWRFLSGPYRNAQKKVHTLFNEAAPSDLDAQLRAVDAIMNAQQQRAALIPYESLAADLYGEYWLGERSDWVELHRKSEWLEGLFRDVQTDSIPAAIVQYLASDPNRSQLGEQTRVVEDALSAQEASFGLLIDTLKLVLDHSSGGGSHLALPFLDQQGVLRGWAAESGSIITLATYNNLAQQCRKVGLGSVVDLTLLDTYVPAQTSGFLTAALERNWLRAVLKRAYTERPLLGDFSGISHEHTRITFTKLDELALEYNRAKLAALHWNSLPRPDAGGQMHVLRREIAKKARHLPIRQLLRGAGGVIQQIKPVFMMSPLSIATFLSQDGPKFDLVVFDEASQVRPVDAFGAVLRGTQVVVVGDHKQLPPTSFFDSLTNAEDLDEENTTGDLESILGLFAAQGAPQRMLRWHYRSRHESLIAVSNHEFYEDKLVVFPSPGVRKEESGLIYHHLTNTAYDAGRTRANKGEAEAVAHAVMEHARTSPDLTLGVAAFSVAQMQAVMDQLEILRREDPSCESFFAAHPHEPFFVKNLETVQGDERDVIYISIGYGRTADGYLSMNFGPLNREGGERRLNVLITRARMRCEVFTNLSSDDIDLERSNARGVRSLKQFLKYASTGILDIPIVTGRTPDSPFEEAVMDALRQEGYEVRPQVGSAGFFIDIAVVDKYQPGRYLLGIECDGATYHSARSARDRDRLRQQVLEGLGWKIHRIWSTDWFRDPRTELKRTAVAIEAARAMGGGRPYLAPKQVPRTEVTVIPRDTKQTRSARADELPKYILARISVNTQGMPLDELYVDRLAGYIEQVVRVEGPVHLNEVFRRIVEGAGVKRIGSRIEAALTRAASRAELQGLVYRRGEFLWPSSDMRTVLRSRTGVVGISPKLGMIAVEEIALAVQRVVADGHGFEEEKVYHAACQLLGYARVGEEMRQRVSEVIGHMVEQGELLKLEGSKLVLG